MKFSIYILVHLSVILSCKSEPVPKPKAYLRLDYPLATYNKTTFEAPFSFEMNSLAQAKVVLGKKNNQENFNLNIFYPNLKGTLYLSYKPINGDKSKYLSYLKDAQKLTLEHTIKANEIPVTPYQNENQKAYGVFSQVIGNAASPAQFYVSDSTQHFLTGSLYFYSKPNYDSILPAAIYIEKDIKHLMETLSWK